MFGGIVATFFFFSHSWWSMSLFQFFKKKEREKGKCYLKTLRVIWEGVGRWTMITRTVVDAMAPCPDSPLSRREVLIPSCWESWWLLTLNWGPSKISLAQGHMSFEQPTSIDSSIWEYIVPGCPSHTLLLPQLRTTINGGLSSRIPHRVGSSLCCNWISLQLFALF